MGAGQTLELAKKMLAQPAIVFFEVRVPRGEDSLELARAISRLDCSAVVDPRRGVIKVFAAHTMPNGLGFV